MNATRPGHEAFASTLVSWQLAHGRHHLPWQQQRDPYRVWLSEVMLQQTQVATVIDYFNRFMDRFPTVAALAEAPQQAVMALWAGLGYYSRARLLHRCAQMVVAEYGGVFPRTMRDLQRLPGIGPSTAAAIASFCFAEPISIFDGNVKRVLSRLLAFDGDLAVTAQSRALHLAGQQLLDKGLAQLTRPLSEAMPAYTQGLMDLGATVCQLRAPACARCPVASMCAAYSQERTTAFPVKGKKLKRRVERWTWVLLVSPDAVWLETRPQQGVWAGMQAPPLFQNEADVAQWITRHADGAAQETAASFKHVLTHKDLHLTPVTVRVSGTVHPSAPVGAWVPRHALPQAALPAPFKKWFQHQGLIGQ